MIDKGGTLHPLTNQPYDTEAVLQRLLAEYPALLAGELVDPETPRRWMLICPEASLGDSEDSTGRWSVDHLFVDQDAIPTIVEVKRSTDTRIRREVVGQILEYAANGVAYWPVEKLRADFEGLCSRDGVDPDARLADRLGQMDPDAFWTAVRTNLRAGKVRLILVADEIPSEVRRIVEFLNGQMGSAEFLALEIKQFRAGDLRTLVPRVYGQTEQAQIIKGTKQARQWDESSFFSALQQRSPEDVPIAREILDWIRPQVARGWWGRGSTQGSFVPVAQAGGFDYQLFAVWIYSSIELYFQYYANKPGFASVDQRRDLRDRLNAIPGVSLDESALSRRPSVPLSVFRDRAAMQTLHASYAWFLGQIHHKPVRDGEAL